jgi:hypothetical protein
MLERFKREDNENEKESPTRNRVKKFVETHKTELFRDYIPLAATVVGLGIAGRENKLLAGTTAAYLIYDATKYRAQGAFEIRKWKKGKEKAYASFPEELKEELIQYNPQELLLKETGFLNRGELPSHLLPLGDYDPDKIYIIQQLDQEDVAEMEAPEGDMDELPQRAETSEIYKIGLNPTDMPDFSKGILAAHYLLRTKLESQGRTFPPISSNAISSYNRSLIETIDDKNYDELTQHFAQKENKVVKDTETLSQSEVLLQDTFKPKTDMMTYGATYLIGLYEKQRAVNDLKKEWAIDNLTSTPLNIKEELIENNIEDILGEELDLATGTPPLSSPSVTIAGEYQPDTFCIADMNEDPSLDERDKKPPVFALFQEDMPAFVTGILYAHYIIRNNDDASPKISQQTVDAYNASLVKQNSDQDNPENVFALLAEKGKSHIKNKKLVYQLEDIFSYASQAEDQMVVNSALYMIGLYEKQTRIDTLQKRLSPPEVPPTDS